MFIARSAILACDWSTLPLSNWDKHYDVCVGVLTHVIAYNGTTKGFSCQI